MTPDIDIDSLRLLVAVDEFGSLGAAARKLGYSQPAASTRVRAFEARWQLSLVRRTARGSSLTEDGAAVLAWAKSVLHEVDIMRSGMSALSGTRRANVTVAASLTIAEFLLPRWFGELHSRRPGVQPHLRVVNSSTVATLVRSGDSDIGFIESAVVPVDLETRHVGGDRLVVVVGQAHQWARRRTPLTVDAMLKEGYVLREPGSGTRSTFERALRRQPRVVLEASSTTTLLGAAMAGVGPAVVSSRAAAADIESGRLVAVPTVLDLYRPLTAVWAAGQRPNPAASDLLIIAAEAARRAARDS